VPKTHIQAVSSPDPLVRHPSHYGGDTVYEAWKVIRAWKLGFHVGNAVKYICRADSHGTRLRDLRKAVEYLNDEIKFEEELQRLHRLQLIAKKQQRKIKE
jgi:hypothetical protein